MKQEESTRMQSGCGGDPFDLLTFALRGAFFGIRQRMYRILSNGKTRGQSMDDALIVHAISRNGPMTVDRLAEVLGRNLSSVSRQLSQMEEKRLIVKTRKADDRRVVMISLTNAGENSVQEQREKAQRLYAHITRGLSALEQQELIRMLTVLMRNAFDDGLEPERIPALLGEIGS